MTTNWGDAVNTTLVEALTGCRVKSLDLYAHARELGKVDHHLVIGSTLQFAGSRTTVWGAGFINEGRMPAGRPALITAVRGPRSWMELRKAGLACPEVFGDPAVLLPALLGVNKNVGPSIRIGFIPHYSDIRDPKVCRLARVDGVEMLNIRGRPRKFLEKVADCSCVVSTSLHGVIAAESLGVPAVWAVVSNRVRGAGFKFTDYFEGTGRRAPDAVRLTGEESADELEEAAHGPSRPMIDYAGLIGACPFNVTPEAASALKRFACAAG